MKNNKDIESSADKTADKLVKKSIIDSASLETTTNVCDDEDFKKYIYKQNELLSGLSKVYFNDKNCEDFIGSLKEFRENHSRFLYSEITGYCHEKEELETLISNTKKVFFYCDSKSDTVGMEDLAKISLKLYDHVSLADKQKARSKMLYDGIEKRIFEQKVELEELERKIKSEEEKLEQFQEKLSSMKSDLIGQLISLIAMFIAVAFVVFGGISSLNSVSDLLKAIVEQANPTKNTMSMVYKSIILWSLGMYNVLFLLMHSIAKLSDKKFSFIESYKGNCPIFEFLSRYSLLIVLNVIGAILIWHVL